MGEPHRQEVCILNFTALKEFMDHITSCKIPGADCLVHYQNKPVFRYQSGYDDLEAKTRLSENHLFNLYSCTKLVTCAAALQLLEQGRFLLTEPLSDYIPEYGRMQVRSTGPDGQPVLTEAKNSIKIRDLFMMTAGLSYDLTSPAIREVQQSTGGACPTLAVVRALAKEPLLFEPGTLWNYSLCHDVLAGLIEVVSGMTFGQYLRTHIFDPLDMNDTYFVLPQEKQPRLALQYSFSSDTGVISHIGPKAAYKLGPEYESGGAGLISSVDDYMKFANTLCNFGTSERGVRILGRRAVELMRRNHLDAAAAATFNWAQLAGYGYGLGVRTLIDPAAGGALSPVGEFGWAGAAGAYVLIDPDNRLTLFYIQHMLNSQEPYIHPKLRNLVYAGLDL